MERVADRYLPRLDAQRFEVLHGLFDGLRLAGYDGLQRAVLVGADDVAADLLELRVDLVAAEGDRGHLARVGHFHAGHFLGAAGDGAQAVLEGKNAGRGGGRVLAERVAYGHVRLHAELPEQAVHRYVGRHHGRLGELGLLDGGFALGQFLFPLAGLAPDGLGEPDAYHLLQDDVGLVKSGLHHLVLGGEVAHHVDVLRALAGEQQTDLGLVYAGLEGVDAFQLEVERRFGPSPGLAVLGHEFYLLGEVLRGLRHDGYAPRTLGLRHRRLGVGRHRICFRPLGEDRGGFFLGVIDDVFRSVAGESHGLALQAGEGCARVLHYLYGGGGRLYGRAGLGVARVVRAGVFLQQYMEVGAAEAERGYVSAAQAVLVPRLGLGDDLEEVLVYAGVELHAVDGGRQRLVVDRERRLGHGHRSGGGLGMADLGLHGSQAQLLAPAHVRTEHFLQHLHLGRVAHLCGGAVRLDEIHFAGAVVHLLKGVLDGYLLALRVGGGDALALAVGGGADRVDQRVDLVAVPDRVGEALEDVDGDRLGHHEAVGPLVEGVGPVGRQGAYLAELHEGGGAHHLVGAAGHGHVESAGAQTKHRVVERRHGGGAGRVHRHVGAVEVEDVGYAAGRHVGELAGHGVLGDLDDAVVYAGLELRYQGLLLVARQRGEDGGLLDEVLVVELVDAQVGHLLAVGAHRVAEHGRGALGIKGLLGRLLARGL